MKKRPYLLMFTVLLPVFFISSCTSVKKDELVPPGCNTANMSYTYDIVPILQNNCYSCHGENSYVGSNGLVLEGYNNLSYWANSGILKGVISHDPGFIPMPYLQPKIDTCSISKIAAWTMAGAPNN